MNDLRQAAQQALEALELDAYGEPPRHERNVAIAALRAALEAAPDGECPAAGAWSGCSTIGGNCE